MLAKLPDRTAGRFNAGSLRALARHGVLPLETTSADNGKEFSRFSVLQRKLGLAVYFARPYHPWERGLAENTNGLLRQFFPEGLDIAYAAHPCVRYVEALLNNRLRKRLGCRPPLEALRE